MRAYISAQPTQVTWSPSGPLNDWGLKGLVGISPDISNNAKTSYAYHVIDNGKGDAINATKSERSIPYAGN